MKESAPKYWFKAKRFGYGWSYPLSWQGWLVYIICMSGFVFHLALAVEIIQPSTDIAHKLILMGSSVLWLILLIVFSYKKGEPAKWRWGGSDD